MNRRSLLAPLIILSTLNSCSSRDKKTEAASADFTKTSAGMEYQKIIPDVDTGKIVEPGNWLKLQVIQTYNDDTILRDSRKTGPEYMHFDTAAMTKESYAVFTGTKQGDSLEFRVSSDSAFKNKRPPFAKKKGYLITRVKVEKILRTEEEVEKEREGLKKKETMPGYDAPR